MEYITTFDIRLNKEVYYGGEIISGNVVLGNAENLQIRNIRVILRGKAHIQLKLNKSGERRIFKDDQYIINEKAVVWGEEKWKENDNSSVLPSGMHQYPFQFTLPQGPMPCSLETKLGTIRYYIKVIIDTAYSRSPQGIKYFTIIGPPTDCMDEKYRCALLGQDKKITWDGCCKRGALALRIILDRTAYLCGENVRILAHVENRQDAAVWISMSLIQHVEYFTERNVGENRHIACVVLESKTSPVNAHSQGKFDTAQLQSFTLPVVPPTLVGVCRLLQIFYVFRACIEDEKGNQALHMEFPLTIATLPLRKSSMPTPALEYDVCCDHVEGGQYISPEFRIGRSYDEQDLTQLSNHINVVLFRPLYVRMMHEQRDTAVRRLSTSQFNISLTSLSDQCLEKDLI